MNAYISNDVISSQKKTFLSKKSSYRFFLYSLSICFTAVSFLHSSIAHAVKGRAEVPSTLRDAPVPSVKAPPTLKSLEVQITEKAEKAFNGKTNHCDPRSIQTVATFSDLKSLEEVFLDKFSGMSSYEVFQIPEPSLVEQRRLFTSVVNGWVLEGRYANKGDLDFIHFQGPVKKDGSAPISCYYHMVGDELVVESEILSPNVGPANMVVRANNRYITMYKNQSVTFDNLTQTIYSSYKKVEGKPDQLFRQEIWTTSKNNADLMRSVQDYFMNNKPEGRPGFVQIRAFDHNQRARATGEHEVTVELVNQNKIPLTFISNGKIIRLPESTLLDKIQNIHPSRLLKSKSEDSSLSASFIFGSCSLEIDKKTQSFMLVTNTSSEAQGNVAPVKVDAHVMLSLPDALTGAMCY